MEFGTKFPKFEISEKLMNIFGFMIKEKVAAENCHLKQNVQKRFHHHPTIEPVRHEPVRHAELACVAVNRFCRVFS